MTVQYVEIAGQKIAMVPAADYDRLVEMAEDRSDELAADGANERRISGEEYVPIDLIDRIIAGENPLRVWRTYRGQTLDQLAVATDTQRAALSKMENGKLRGSPLLWRKLAGALNVTVDDILPES